MRMLMQYKNDRERAEASAREIKRIQNTPGLTKVSRQKQIKNALQMAPLHARPSIKSFAAASKPTPSNPNPQFRYKPPKPRPY